jgi:hypothetical protein
MLTLTAAVFHMPGNRRGSRVCKGPIALSAVRGLVFVVGRSQLVAYFEQNKFM